MRHGHAFTSIRLNCSLTSVLSCDSKSNIPKCGAQQCYKGPARMADGLRLRHIWNPDTDTPTTRQVTSIGTPSLTTWAATSKPLAGAVTDRVQISRHSVDEPGEFRRPSRPQSRFSRADCSRVVWA